MQYDLKDKIVFITGANSGDENMETVFATNHLGPFPLTHSLLDALKADTPDVGASLFRARQP